MSTRRRIQRTGKYGSDYENFWSDSNLKLPGDYCSDHSDAPNSESDDEYNKDRRPTKRVKRQSTDIKKPTTPQVKVRTKASIVSLATDTLPNQECTSAGERLSGIDSSVIARIKKALALAHHEGTGEQEAKAAFRMAAKLMTQHSINQADILAEENKEERMKRAGMSVVSIRSLFDSTVRRTAHPYLEVLALNEPSMVRLAEHTVAAAYAFEMAYNLILEWSQAKEAGQGRREKTTYRIGVGDGLRSLAKREKQEEEQRAIESEKRLLEATRKAEEEEDRARLERLEQPIIADDPPTALDKPAKKQVDDTRDERTATDTKVKIEEVDDEDYVIPVPVVQSTHTRNEAGDESPDEDHGDPGNYFRRQSLSYAGSPPAFKPDFDDSDDDINLIDLDAAEPKYQPQVPAEVQNLPNAADTSNPRQVTTSDPVQVKADDQEAEWKSVQQLVTFRGTSVAMAEDWLESQQLKLKKRRTAVRTHQNGREKALYKQGREDAKKNDVRRKRIKNAEDDY